LNGDGEIRMKMVRKIRLNLLMSQVEFGKLCGLTRQMVWRYETGRSYPSIEVIRFLLEKGRELGMNIKAEDFFD
jgi:transcriptional regulator with XRE-family HTH domain